MKTKNLFTFIFFTFAFCLLPSALIYSQVPLGFNYQAVVRDAQNTVISGRDVSLQISILKGSENGLPVYVETHQETTNSFGLITLEIGNGTMISGNLPAIDWSADFYFMKIELDAEGGTDYEHMGTSKLLSVPYALNAGSVTSLKSLSIMEQIGHVADSALFEVKNQDGNTVFAVYNEGVRVYVNDDPAKGLKGGFAVGGFSASKGISQDYLRITPDSIRMYLDEESGKGLKGGFAVGGFGASKAPPQEYLRVTPDSVRIYINDTISKGLKGGFAVGGFGASKGSTDLLHLNKDNYFIGHNSGSNTTTGTYNSFFGYQAGMANSTGNNNVFLGYKAGTANVSANENIFIGYQAGTDAIGGNYNVVLGSNAGYKNNGHYNVFIGYESGYNNIGGADSRYSKWNTFIGYQSGKGNTTGWQNLCIGYQAGFNNQTATNQFFIGNGAGKSLIDGHNNTFVGHLSGQQSTDCYENTFIGYQTGYNNLTGHGNTYLGNAAGLDAPGSGNVFIGNRVGWNETGDNKLYIDNSSVDEDNALIYGEFNNGVLKLNATTHIRDALVLKPRDTAPSSPEKGMMYMDSVTNKLMVYDGTTWKTCW